VDYLFTLFVGVDVTIGGLSFAVDLLVLDMEGYDVILGRD